ncbi:MAG TPA: galactokinase [Flavisolibacter sp.]|nr:galactokinase [Flavisolibacter sp.]
MKERRWNFPVFSFVVSTLQHLNKNQGKTIMNQEIVTQINNYFQQQFNSQPQLYRSPGRVNIIGEHTDYNNGFVLPAAIDKAMYLGINRREDDIILLHSLDFNETLEIRLEQVQPQEAAWANYVLGVVAQLQKRACALSGFNLVFAGDVPIGSGLSSSAAVECAVAFALNESFSLGLSKQEMAFIAQKAEHEYAKVMCGIMDQFASVFGKRDHLIKLDCRSIEFEYVPLNLNGHKIVLFNTNVSHSLASSEYNTRRAQCEQGVGMVKDSYPEVESLRDVDLLMLDEMVKPKDHLIYRRCRYVVEENQRLLQGCDDLQRGDISALGEKMFLSHQGLSRDYEVSCKELDFLAEAVKAHPAVLGARMMGGGFGGCTINIIKEEAIESIVPELTAAYEQAMNLPLTTYIVTTSDGSGKLTL